MRYGRRDIESTIRSVLDFLSQQGFITSGVLPTDATIPPVLQHYLDYFSRHTCNRSPSFPRQLQGSLRSFLRFCHLEGYLERDLTGVIPPIHSYKLSGLPRGISDADTRKTLVGIDRTTSLGLRDFAIILLLHTYGVRGSQVRALLLQDIEWHDNRIRFTATKGGKEVVVPLTDQYTWVAWKRAFILLILRPSYYSASGVPMMKLSLSVFVGIFLVLTSTTAVEAASLEKCKKTLEKFSVLGNVPEMMAESYGYAVLPTIGKGGIGIGGAGGRGCVFAGGKQTGKVSMGQVTIGWQLGGQAYSQIILFKNADVYTDFIKGQFEFGADATAVALTYGASAGASTKGASASAGDTKAVGSWKRGMAVFTLAKGGLMYEASIGGQKFNFKPINE